MIAQRRIERLKRRFVERFEKRSIKRFKRRFVEKLNRRRRFRETFEKGFKIRCSVKTLVVLTVAN
jgi:hypothetical protein